MKRCDGENSVAAIVADLEQAFDTTGLEPEVRGFVELAGQQNWLRWDA
jgi:pyrroloquinoline quinone biosynthesis protein D